MDIKYAKELGYKIKHVGITGLSDNSIECRVHPVLVPVKDILAQVSGVMNSVILKGDRFGTSMLYGHGAGGSATASAVVSDFVDAINGTGLGASSGVLNVDLSGESAVTIGASTSEVTVGDNLTVAGDLTVNGSELRVNGNLFVSGTTTTINTTNLTIQDVEVIRQIIEICSQRGAFKQEEINLVNQVYQKIIKILPQLNSQVTAPKAPLSPIKEGNTEEDDAMVI